MQRAGGGARNPFAEERNWYHGSIDKDDLWNVGNKPYAQWITNIVVAILDGFPKHKTSQLSKTPSVFGAHLAPLAKASVDFCTAIFPWLLCDIMDDPIKSRDTCKVLSRRIGKFFETMFEDGKKAKPSPPFLKVMLEVVRFLRCQERKGGQTKWDSNFWLSNLDYLHVAFAAFECQDYFSTIVYCDIWCQAKQTLDIYLQSDFSVTCLSKGLLDGLLDYFDPLDKCMSADIRRCQSLMANAYEALDEKDAVEGCGSYRRMQFKAHVQRLFRENKHAKAIALYDAKLSLAGASQSPTSLHEDEAGLLTAMKEAGYLYTSGKLEAYQKECLQDLESWQSGPEAGMGELTFEDGCHQGMDYLLKLHDQHSFREHMNNLSLQTSKHVKNANSSIMASNYDLLAKFKMLNELEVVAEILNFEDLKNGRGQTSIPEMFKSFTDDDDLLKLVSYKSAKPILEQRCELLAQLPFLRLDRMTSPMKNRVQRITEIKKSSIVSYVENVFRLCDLALANNDYQCANRQLTALSSLKERCSLEISNTIVDDAGWKIIDNRYSSSYSILCVTFMCVF